MIRETRLPRESIIQALKHELEPPLTSMHSGPARRLGKLEMIKVR